MKPDKKIKKFSDDMKKNTEILMKIKVKSFKRRLLFTSKRLGFDFTKSLN